MAIERAFDTVFAFLALILIGSVIANAAGFPFLGCSSGGSMEPIVSGDKVILIDPTVEEVDDGDLIIYEPVRNKQYELIAHRVVRITKHGYITKGIANTYTDQAVGEPPVSRDRIIGKPVQIAGHLAVIPFPNCSTQGVRLTLVLVAGGWIAFGLKPKHARWHD